MKNVSDTTSAGPGRSRSGHAVRTLVASVLILAGIIAVTFMSEARESAPSVKPTTNFVPKDGRRLGGVYAIDANGKKMPMARDEVKSILFDAHPAPGTPAKAAPTPLGKPQRKRCDQSDIDLVERLFPRDNSGHSVIDKSLIPQVVAKGAAVIEPLLEKIEENSSRYETVGGIFAQMDPSPLPVLMDIYRRYPSGAARLSLPYLLREGGSQSQMWLTKMLKSPDSHVRHLALKTLDIMSKRSITMTKELEQLLFGSLKDSDPKVRATAPLIIAHHLAGNDAVVPALLDVMKNHPEGRLRSATVSAFGRLVGSLGVGAADLKKIIDGLVWTMLNDSNMSAREYAARCLGKIDSKSRSAAAALLKASDHKNHRVRTAARKALAKTGAGLPASLRKAGADDDTVTLILELIASNLYEGKAVIDKMVKLGPGNLAALMEVSRNPGTNSRWRIVSQVIAGWDDKVVDKLTKYAADENRFVRQTAARAWGQMASIDALPKGLENLLHDEHRLVRSTLIESLLLWSKRDSPKLRKAVLPLLMAAMSDEVIQFRHLHPVWARMETLAPENPEIITEMIRITKTSISGTVRNNAITSLRYIGEKLPPDHKGLARIVDALAETLRDDGDLFVMRYAITALGAMGPRAGAALGQLRKTAETSGKFLSKPARRAIEKIKAAS